MKKKRNILSMQSEIKFLTARLGFVLILADIRTIFYVTFTTLFYFYNFLYSIIIFSYIIILYFYYLLYIYTASVLSHLSRIMTLNFFIKHTRNRHPRPLEVPLDLSETISTC